MHWDFAAMLTTIFMVAVVCYWVTRPHPISKGGPVTKSQTVRVLGVVALGFATSLLPIVRTNVPVMGRTEWSGLGIVSQVEVWKFPPSPVVLDIASTYLLMLLAAAAVFLPRPRKLLLLISLLGIISSSWALEMGHSLLFDCFIRLGGTLRKLDVDYGVGMYAPEIVMSSVLLIATDLT